MGFSGLFLRDNMGDTPGAAYDGQGWTDSPDIIVNGTQPVLDPSSLTTSASYTTEPPDTLYVGSKVTNYVYVRALNATAGATEGRLWLWYAEPNLLLWPQNWISNTIWVDGVQQNWSNVRASAPNQIVVSDAFAVVSPVAPQDHYCTIAISECPREDPAEPPYPGFFANLADLAAWIQASPNAAFRNTVDRPLTTSTWNWMTPISGPQEAGSVVIGVKCQNMPVGSQFQFMVPGGTTGSGQAWAPVESGVMTVTQPGQSVSVEVDWPGGVSAGMNITWWANGTTPANGASIAPFVGVSPFVLEGLVEHPMLGAQPTLLHEDLQDPRSARLEHVHIVGATPIRMV
jgi:hypothetical protein